MRAQNRALDEIAEADRALIMEAQRVMRRAYNVYSQFWVGAAVRTASGRVYPGTFMENASLGMTICAEAAALLAANTAGDLDVASLAVVGGRPGEDGAVVTPCGRCRQIIYEVAELMGHDISVYCANGTLSRIVETSIHELLPLAFGPQQAGMKHLVDAYKQRHVADNCG